jgi:hypothetical protein
MSEEPKKRTRKAKPKYEVAGANLEYLDTINCELDWLNPLHERYGLRS